MRRLAGLVLLIVSAILPMPSLPPRAQAEVCVILGDQMTCTPETG